jgi:YCII-related domain
MACAELTAIVKQQHRPRSSGSGPPSVGPHQTGLGSAKPIACDGPLGRPRRLDASSGTPLFTDGPFIESKEHLGGFAVVDVPDEAAARLWAGRIAVACGWPQEVHRFGVPT